MRGKIVVGVILLATLIFGVYSVWYFGSKSPVDQRFNQTRVAIPPALAGATITDVSQTAVFFPDALADFVEKTSVPMTLPTVGDGPLHGEVIYTNSDGGSIRLTVDHLKDGTAPLSALKTSLGATDAAIFHQDALLPYGYQQATVDGQPLTTFSWINGHWIFNVSSSDVDAETLLLFVNTYAF